MTTTYKFTTVIDDEPSIYIVKKLVDGENPIYIPKSEGNADYQEYLEWAKTNTAEEAD